MNRLGDPQTSPHRAPADDHLRARPPGTIRAPPAPAWARPNAARRRLVQGSRAAPRAVAMRAPWSMRSARWRSAAPTAWGRSGANSPAWRAWSATKEKEASLMSGYLDCLSRLRTRLNQLKNQGDPGPGAKQFMQQTLEGNGSELADALKYVDEQMLTGMSDAQKSALRPLLVRPLMQTFAMIVLPSESEINKTWQAQVLDPFAEDAGRQVSVRARAAAMEATSAEIGQVFGPEGAVAKFINTSMGPLVVRRGDMLSGATWADMGITSRRRRCRASRAGSRPCPATACAPRPAARRKRCSSCRRSRRPARPNTRSRSTASSCATGTRRRCGRIWCSRVRRAGRRAHQRRHLRRPHRGAVQRAWPVRPAENDRWPSTQQKRRRRVRTALGQRQHRHRRSTSRWSATRPAAPASGKGFQGLRLPPTIVGRPVAEPGRRHGRHHRRRSPVMRAPRPGPHRLLRQDPRAQRLRQAGARRAGPEHARRLAGRRDAAPALDARWKLNYDAMAPVSFAFVGPARRHAVAGHLVASRDAPGRRYPFLMMRTLDVLDPSAFVSRCPLAFAPLWSFLEAAAPQVRGRAPTRRSTCKASATRRSRWANTTPRSPAFWPAAPSARLSRLLGDEDASRVILALGLLLQPVMHSKPAQLDKSLVLPLPDDAALRAPVAAFWLELMAPFVRRAAFDLALFLTTQEERPVLVHRLLRRGRAGAARHHRSAGRPGAAGAPARYRLGRRAARPGRRRARPGQLPRPAAAAPEDGARTVPEDLHRRLQRDQADHHCRLSCWRLAPAQAPGAAQAAPRPARRSSSPAPSPTKRPRPPCWRRLRAVYGA